MEMLTLLIALSSHILPTISLYKPLQLKHYHQPSDDLLISYTQLINYSSCDHHHAHFSSYNPSQYLPIQQSQPFQKQHQQEIPINQNSLHKLKLWKNPKTKQRASGSPKNERREERSFVRNRRWPLQRSNGLGRQELQGGGRAGGATGCRRLRAGGLARHRQAS